MRVSRPVVVAVALVVVGAVVAWRVSRRPDDAPLSIPSSTLTGWTVTVSDGTDPWVAAALPPDALTGRLFQEATRRAGHTLIAPAHPALPLVLRTEFEEGLQGVYGTDSVVRIAREAGVESSTFQPVCLARKVARHSGRAAELYFVAFESPVFDQMRIDLVPPEPEHAGIGTYEPATVTPALIVAATDRAFDQWWPLQFDAKSDCIGTLSLSDQR